MRRTTPRPAASNVKIIVIILICVGFFFVLGIAACAGLGFFAFRTVSKELGAAQSAADAFFNQLQANQLQAAYQSTTADFQAQQTFAQFSGFVALHPNLTGHSSRTMGGFQMNTVNGVKQATLPYTLSGPGGATTCTLVLQDTGGGWKVHRLTVP
jgi:hypothetical protein